MGQKIKDIQTARAKKHIRDIIRALESDNLAERDVERLKAQLSEHMKRAAGPRTGGSVDALAKAAGEGESAPATGMDAMESGRR